jgi:hypothetical protein
MALLTYASARYSLLMSNQRISTAPVSGGVNQWCKSIPGSVINTTEISVNILMY